MKDARKQCYVDLSVKTLNLPLKCGANDKEGFRIDIMSKTGSVENSLVQERNNIKFPIQELRYHLYGGKVSTEKLLSTMDMVQRDPIFNNRAIYDLSYEEIRKVTFEQVARIHELLGDEIMNHRARRRLMSPIGLVNPSAQTRLSIHISLFLGTLYGQGTDKQIEYWVKRGAVSLRKFYGCFGMTELGHGSNVAGLETTATLDLEKDEFVINTPHVRASKWWIGGAAHSANHTACYARLIVKGKDYGVCVFIVPLRSIETHELLTGVAIGDIGQKMGRDGIDNGWMQFTNVRIPRYNMLMKYCRVEADGTVIEPPLAQLAYGALVGGRVSMVEDSWWCSKRYLTIALRYAAVRRQFSTNGSEETRLLDYRYHQRRLIPLLAQALALQASTQELNAISESIKPPTTLDDPNAIATHVQASKELFSLSAGLKALATWSAQATIDECRQACGGHGYSGYSGFGQGYDDWVVNCTWEGDNNILNLSTGRTLIQNGIRLLNGEKAFGTASYLNNASLKEGSLNDVSYLSALWLWVTRKLVLEAAAKYKSLSKSVGNKAAMEKLSATRVYLARFHSIGFAIRSLADSAARAMPEIREVLFDCATLFALWSIEKEAALFLETGSLDSVGVQEVFKLVDEYCFKIRKVAIGIVDSFALPDFFVNSVLGNHDGDVYNNYFKKVTDANPSQTAKAHYYDSIQKPFFKRPEEIYPELDDI